MNRKLSTSLLIAMALCGCTKQPDPVLACQQRLASARDVVGSADDQFNHAAYAKLDRTGCTAPQLAMLDRILVLTKELPGLTDNNEQIARNGSEAEKMAAFQRMNNAVIALGEQQQVILADLAKMEAPQ
jgi:hypothetical protein